MFAVATYPEIARLRPWRFAGFDFASATTRIWEYPWLLEGLARFGLGRGGRVADLGAGQSPLGLALARRGYRVTVVDHCLAGAPGARPGYGMNPRQYPRELRKLLSYRTADLRRLPFAGGSFEAVVSVSVIEHLPAPAERQAVLAEMKRILAAPGIMIVTEDFAREPERREWDYREHLSWAALPPWPAGTPPRPEEIVQRPEIYWDQRPEGWSTAVGWMLKKSD